jgi:hypothetical protein
MSLQDVDLVIDALLNDEELRTRFAVSRIEAILELIVRGVVLTPGEIELFVKSDARLWYWTREVTGGRVH